MNNPAQQQEDERPKNPLVVLRNDLEDRRDSYLKLLEGSGISFDKFKAATLSGVNKNPELIRADKASLFDSVSQACRDGLLPDGREGALVIHNTKVKTQGQPDRWVAMVAWMPMVKGILKKVRQAEEVSTITMNVVYQGDTFDYWVDEDGEHLLHRPSWEADRADSNITHSYAMVRMTDGERQIEVVTRADLEKMKAASKTGAKGYGPWKDWFAQMCKKSALHRLAPKLPLPDAIVEAINRDEALYDFNKPERAEKDITPGKAEKGRSSRLSSIIGTDDDAKEDTHERDQGDHGEDRSAGQPDNRGTSGTMEDFDENAG